MVTGSVVSSIQGEPRSTHDINMVIILEKQAVRLLSQSFVKDVFYINEDSMMEAIDRQSMFNLIDSTSGNKVDFWLLTNDLFDQTRFARRRNAEVLGLDNFYVTTPEDTILRRIPYSASYAGPNNPVGVRSN